MWVLQTKMNLGVKETKDDVDSNSINSKTSSCFL